MIGLEPTVDPLRWKFPLTPPICAGSIGDPFLFGGSALGAVTEAMAASTGRAPIWVTAQYLSYAKPPAILDVAVSIVSAGKQITQASALLSIEGRTVVAASGAFGARDVGTTDSWRTLPIVPKPEECPHVRHRSAYEYGVETSFELRLANGRYPIAGEPFGTRSETGRIALWVKPSLPSPVNPGMLAIVGDFVSIAISDAVGRYGFGNSLDNTIRFARIEQSEWLLCDIEIQAVHSGFVHGSMHIFSQAGQLMAIASTSLILRFPEPSE
jgi:acyl-CoA thioesterase II